MKPGADSRICPPAAALGRVAALAAEGPEESAVRAHARECAACAAELRALDPLGELFARLPRRTLPEPVWDSVLAVLRSEVVARPRQAPSGLLAALRALLDAALASPLSAAAAAASLVVVVGLTAALLAGGGAPPSRLATALPTVVPMYHGTSFVYLSNPDAEVAHVLVSGTQGAPPVQVTMVIDSSLGDELFP